MQPMSDKTVSYAPFNAINEFMIPDYREEVIRFVLLKMNALSGKRKASIQQLIKKNVTVPGFRNSTIAPLPMQIKGAASAFMKNPAFTAQILSAWVELKPGLAAQIFELLKERNWEVLPVDVDRAALPGFLIQWPAGETYDTLGKAYGEKYSGSSEGENDIRLMMVWLSGRLPYDTGDSDGEDRQSDPAGN